MEDFDVETLRAHTDHGMEWKLKRHFILAHHDKFETSRLVCLANCFANVECNGCLYPTEVMDQLRDLSIGLGEDFEADRAAARDRNKLQPVKFVKSSECNQETPKETYNKVLHGNYGGVAFVRASADNDGENEAEVQEVMPPNNQRLFESMEGISETMETDNADSSLRNSLVKLSNALGIDNSTISTLTESRDAEMEMMITRLSSQLREMGPCSQGPISALHMACDKLKMAASETFEPNKSGFMCTVMVNCIPVCDENASSKKVAKSTAYQSAIRLLTMPHIKIINGENDSRKFYSSTNPYPSMPSMSSAINPAPKQNIMPCKSVSVVNPRKRKTFHHPAVVDRFSQFVIVQPDVEGANAISVLQHSASFNRVPFNLEFHPTECFGGVICSLSLGDQLVMEVESSTQKTGKLEVCQQALKLLKAKCCTILSRQNADTTGASMTRDDVMGNLKAQIQAIPDSNIGSQLLKKMGWSGGGIGAEGNKGIVEPIQATSMIRREGLGLQAEQGISKTFLPRMKEVLNNYVLSTDQQDLEFSAEFGKEERALVHKEAQKLGLKTKSHGKGDDRKLIVSRKRNAGELFEHILYSGGETSKYTLVPPGGDTPDL